MNCAECRDNLVAWAEGLLDRETMRQCQAHLKTCADCQGEYASITSLQGRLVAHGQAAAAVAIVEPVMRRVLREKRSTERNIIMSTLLKYRWGFGLGTAAIAAVVGLMIALGGMQNTQAAAVEVMTKGAQAVAQLTSIHLRGELRTYPQDNFSYINADSPFYSIELWKQFEPDLKWRIEKPKRVVVMDGQSTVMLIKTDDTGVKLPQRTESAFDTDWLHRIANVSNAITNEINNARARGWKLSLEKATGADGRLKSVVTILAKSGVPDNDYTKNTFMENADTRRVYHFDAQTELLEGLEIYLVRPAGETKIFDLTQIEYNPPMDASVWKLDLPADVSWAQLETPKLPDNDKYASMTAEQAARTFFEACHRKDWDEAGKFMSPINANLKQVLGGVEIISLGESFTSKNYPGRFVPYEIKFSQEFNVRVSNANPARRYVITGVYGSDLKLQVDLAWTNQPVVLTNNDVYAQLSPADAVKRYFEAAMNLNWDEMRKFAPDYDVANDKSQIEAAQKQGADVQKMLSKREAIEAFWSAEQNSWFVKCRATQTKKWNIAVRKDNAAGRWQVDGGI